MYSDYDSFKEFRGKTRIPVCSIYEKGDIRRRKTGEKYTDYKISFDASKKDWDDFKGQVKDVIEFLLKYQDDLKDLMKTHRVNHACLDFPLYSRLDDKIINQNDYLPSELISLAGSLNLSIGMSIYSKEIFDTDANQTPSPDSVPPSGEA